MRKLLLLRHAKSDRSQSSDVARNDHARPLNARGRMAAAAMGNYMREKDCLPELVLCSTSKRTRETLEILLATLGSSPEIQFGRRLYLAEWPKLLEVVRAAPDAASPLLVVGHNPGMEQLAHALAGQPKTIAERKFAKEMALKFPTCALAVLDFKIAGWRAMNPGIGRLADFVRPKDLPQTMDGEEN